jgi:hypothetical protein
VENALRELLSEPIEELFEVAPQAATRKWPSRRMRFTFQVSAAL